jgi:hypothetical protein
LAPLGPPWPPLGPPWPPLGLPWVPLASLGPPRQLLERSGDHVCTSFRAISWSTGRSDEKRPTCNPYAPWRSDCVLRPPRRTPKSSENRSGSVSRATVRKARSQKLIQGLPGALFDRSGASNDVPRRSRGVPRALRAPPGVSRERPRSPPNLLRSSRGPPGAIWDDFWWVFRGFSFDVRSIFASFSCPLKRPSVRVTW